MSNNNFNTYYIVKDVKTASDVIDILQHANVSDEHIGVVSKDSDIALADLPQLDISEESKLPEALTRGAVLGTGSGLLAGILLTAFPVAGITLGGAAIASMAAGGAAFGAWSASMVGISESSSLVEEFDDALHSEYTLIFCFLDDNQESEVGEKIKTSNITGIVKKGSTTE